MNEVKSEEQCAFPPRDVTDADMAFGGIDGLMPPRGKIPEDFHRGNNWGNRLFSAWFYSGLKSLELNPKPGIDKAKAMRHIRTIMRSFRPSHEDKEATCAYLFDLWFEPGKWETKSLTAHSASIVLADGHTTVGRALEVANEMHDLAEERAEDCDDTAAGLLSEGATLIEMLAAKLAEGRA